MNQVLLLQDNARPHKGGNCNMGWTVLPHAPYSPDLAPSDFHFLGPLKDALRGRLVFADDNELKHSVREKLWRVSKDIYAIGTQRLRKSGKSCSIMKETLWKKNLKFVNNVRMKYVNFIIILITVSENK
jgi:hypothetical protein